MANALAEKRQKKKTCLISITEIINAQARRSLRVRGSIRTNVKPDDNNQWKLVTDFNQNYQLKTID